MEKSLTCPACRSSRVIKKGTARLKYGDSQTYLCRDCGRKFRERSLSHKSYRPNVITAALTRYNLGYTIEETVKYINRRFKVKTSKSSVHGWIKEFSDVCTYHRIRDRVIADFGKDIIVSKDFEHHGLNYNFKYHRGKVAHLSTEFKSLAEYIMAFEKGCPDYYKNDERPSQLKIDYDSDGKADPAIFRPSSGLWAIKGVTRNYFGTSNDEPVPADYNWNGADDIGIFRENSGLWAIRGVTRCYFGRSGDIPITRPAYAD